MMRVGRILASALQFLDEGENLLRDNLEHLSWSIIFELRPAQVFLLWLEDWILNRPLQPIRHRLFSRVQLIEPFDKKQIRNLLDHFERIRNTTRPKRVPQPIDF